MAQIFNRSSKVLARKRRVRLCQCSRILQYLAVSADLVTFWLAWFCTHLKSHPLVQTTGQCLTKTLEPEHAHA